MALVGLDHPGLSVGVDWQFIHRDQAQEQRLVGGVDGYQPNSDRGVALSVFVACAVPFMILIVGIAVDSTGQIVLEQRARAVAAEAARSGGQAVSGGINGDATQANPVLARQAALDYLAASGLEGEVTVEDGLSL